MDNICKICGEIVTERKHYYSKHKIKESDYFIKYFPKFDLQTNEPVLFKSPEQYEMADFTDKRNLKKYLESKTKEDGLNYCKDWLIRRKELKNLIFSLSEFEVKSLCYPSISFFHKFFGPNSYENLCESVGLINRYNYNQKLEFDENKEIEFICDSREQQILNLSNKQIEKLEFGDYTIKDNRGIYIERKSINDFISTMSQGFDRFCRELDRCVKKDGYLVILIEEKYSSLNSYPYLPHTKQIKAKPDFIAHQFRQILNTYPTHCQMLAVDGRKEAVRILEKIFKIKQNIREIDLTYAYNLGII